MPTFTAYIEFDPETQVYVGTIPSIPGANTQGRTLTELQENLREVLEVCVQEQPDLVENLPYFAGILQIEI